MTGKVPSCVDDLTSNLTALEAFWRRRSFHDMAVMSVVRTNRRVIVELAEFILVLSEVNHYDGALDEFPDSWIAYGLSQSNDSATLVVELECGRFTARFRNVRLLRRVDYAVLVPPIDP